jgi:thiol-disulfide isomerase/thioredoxin
MQLPNARLLLVIGLVLAIMFYLFVLMSDKKLKPESFADLGEKTNVFTLYYMNGCPHCETILPEYKKFAAAGQVMTGGKKTKIRMLEQSDPNAAPELEARNVKGFPTFVLSTVDGKHIEYQGERSVPAIGQFINQNAL